MVYRRQQPGSRSSHQAPMTRLTQYIAVYILSQKYKKGCDGIGHHTTILMVLVVALFVALVTLVALVLVPFVALMFVALMFVTLMAVVVAVFSVAMS